MTDARRQLPSIDAILTGPGVASLLSEHPRALVVKAVKPPAPTLAELLRGITDENLPGEWDTGPATGKEVW